MGTRIAVYDVLEYLASGMTHAEIVADFPELTEPTSVLPSSSPPCASAASQPCVRLLFDQNLSRRLVEILASEFPDSAHVGTLGLDTATDRVIWDYAAEHDYVTASKDSDFRQLAFLHGPPPKALWLRVGNASTNTIADVLRTHVDDIKTFAQSEDEALLVLPDLER